MTLLLNNIKPYEGLDEIKSYSKLDEVKRYLDNQNIEYTSEVWKAEEETIPNPWTVYLLKTVLICFLLVMINYLRYIVRTIMKDHYQTA